MAGWPLGKGDRVQWCKTLSQPVACFIPHRDVEVAGGGVASLVCGRARDGGRRSGREVCRSAGSFVARHTNVCVSADVIRDFVGPGRGVVFVSGEVGGCVTKVAPWRGRVSVASKGMQDIQGDEEPSRLSSGS